MWKPRRFTNLWASTVCYRDIFTFTFTVCIYVCLCSQERQILKKTLKYLYIGHIRNTIAIFHCCSLVTNFFSDIYLNSFNIKEREGGRQASKTVGKGILKEINTRKFIWQINVLPTEFSTGIKLLLKKAGLRVLSSTKVTKFCWGSQRSYILKTIELGCEDKEFTRNFCKETFFSNIILKHPRALCSSDSVFHSLPSMCHFD
jgi:hypothetical protein